MIRKISVAISAICLLAAPLTCYANEPPRIVAHRGLLHHAPENTLANFRACLELHLGFEFDVEKTKDGHLICIHDDTVDRTTNGTGKVADLTLEEFRRLDAGSWFDLRFAGENVPTIEEVLKLLSEPQQDDTIIPLGDYVDIVEVEIFLTKTNLPGRI